MTQPVCVTQPESVDAPVFFNEDIEDFFENAALSLHWVGPDGTILRANRYELDSLGYSREEYEGHNITEFHADEDVIADILERLTRGDTLVDYEAQMIAKDGSIRHVLINSNVRWDSGEFVHTRCFTRDVTDAKFAEEEMRRQAMQLNDQVIQEVALAKMSLEMNDAKKAAGALSRALASAKAVVSHLLTSAKKVRPGDLVRSSDDVPSDKA